MRRAVEITPTRELLARACEPGMTLADRLARYDRLLDRLMSKPPRGLSEFDIEESWQLTGSERQRVEELKADLLLALEAAGPTVARGMRFAADPEARVIRRSLP